MKKSKFILFVSAIVFTLSIQAKAAENKEASYILQDHAELKTLLETVNEEHRSVQKPVVDFEQYIENFSADESEYQKYQENANDFNPETILNKESITADMDILFKVLETTYGGYYYFGGDEAFGAAKKAILNECGALENVTGKRLEESIKKNLSIIKDSHFTLNNNSLYDYFLANMYIGADFIKDGGEFRNSATGKKLIGIEGYTEWKDLFKRFISEKGELVYRPVIISAKRPESATIKVQYEDKTLQTLNKSYRNSNFEFVSVSGFGDIPVIRCQYSMGFDHSKEMEYGSNLFLESAQKYKDEPILIVDIRNNGGGNGLLPLKWFKEYTGEFVPTNYSTLKYMSDKRLKNNENKDNPYYIPYAELTGIGGFTPISESYMKANAQPDKFVGNEQLLIILVNKNSASSSEIFVDIAHNLENTLIVGTNTGGLLVGDAFTSIYLPNSGIKVQLGAGISFFPDNYFEEYIGFEPDLWVDGNAEEMIYKFLYKD